MGKLTWNSIGRIYGSEFGLTPKEAAQIISNHIFSKNWYGSKTSPGRMWQDQETCRALCILLSEIGKYEKKNKVKFKTTYSVKFDSDKLINACIEALDGDGFQVKKGKLHFSKAAVSINKGGVDL